MVDPPDCSRHLKCMSEIDLDDIDDNLECMSEIDLDDIDENLEVMSEIDYVKFSSTILSRLNLAGRTRRGDDSSDGDGSGEPSTASAAAEVVKTELVQVPAILDIAAAAAPKAVRPQDQLGGMPMLKASNEVPQLVIADRCLVAQPLGSASIPPSGNEIQQNAEFLLPAVGRQTDYCASAKARAIDNWLNADNDHHYPSLCPCAPIPIHSGEPPVSVF